VEDRKANEARIEKARRKREKGEEKTSDRGNKDDRKNNGRKGE